MLRIWGHWRQIEPEEGKFTADIMDLPMKEIARYGYEPIFCLVGNFIIHGGRQGLERRLKRGNSNLPEYLFQWYHQSSDPGKGSVLPPIEVYGRYLDFVLAHWGKQVRIWEVSNEPGIFGMPAKNYIDYLKYTNRTVKARRPDAVILGNGVTGDFGINVVKWCEQLNEADPNYVDSLDGIAFHPYASGLDYLNGIRGLYGQCVKNIRNKLARPRPLWNTECYYLPAARFRQINHGREFSRYGANDIQRHFLDGLYHGVTAAASPDPSSYFHRTGNTVNLISFNEVAAAQNALSALLEGMEKLEKVELNPQIRSALFLSRDGKRALGFLYDFRPSGSTWIPGRADGVKILDLYGNDRTAAGKYHLGFEPYYLAGTPDAVRKALTGSRFELENPVEFHGRRFGDLLLLDAKNLSGLPRRNGVRAWRDATPPLVPQRRRPHRGRPALLRKNSGGREDGPGDARLHPACHGDAPQRDPRRALRLKRNAENSARSERFQSQGRRREKSLERFRRRSVPRSGTAAQSLHRRRQAAPVCVRDPALLHRSGNHCRPPGDDPRRAQSRTHRDRVPDDP
ncbi:MAG: hypothetical protein L6W00_02895 [Lentisphaeria bacterium]|nr:MAG: hypothetical protein L6W00_02895 [Lentisphaeria bacterium]